MIQWLPVVKLALLGGFLGLDRGPFLQSLMSRPLPAATLAGYLLGDPGMGLFCGLLLEPLWMMTLPVGGAVPPNETAAAITAAAAGTACAAVCPGVAGAALGVTLALPVGWFGAWLETMVRRRNGADLRQARRDAEAGRVPSLGWAMASGAARFFAASAFAAAVGAWLAPMAAAMLLRWLGPMAPVVFGVQAALLVVAGAGAVLTGLPGWQSAAAFGLGAAGGSLGKAVWPWRT